jgi:hypothetical protein
VITVALAMALAVAHALELPGKMRLPREVYFAVQRIYYPGFTVAGMSEPASIALTIALLFLTPADSVAFGLTLAALLCLIVMHVVFWVFVQPVNKVRVQGETLGRVGAGFFAVGRPLEDRGQPLKWTTLRDRWEFAHLARAGLAVTCFILLVLANASGG